MPAPFALGQNVITCYGFNATIVGSPGIDTMVGIPGRDIIVTLVGGDRVQTLDGDDIICGGDGYNTFIGGTGNDTLLGEGIMTAFMGALFGTNKGNIENGDGGPDFDVCVDVKNVTNCEG